MKKAFTLIELLVVVIIIGILAAIALPQYEKAVQRSKSAQAVTMLRSVYQAAEEYYMANGTWPQKFADLSVTPPWTGTTKYYVGDDISDVLSDVNWSLQLINYTSSGQYHYFGFTIGALSGKYAGGGFAIWKDYPAVKMPRRQIVCVEKIAGVSTPGDYCQKVMQSGELLLTGGTLRYYKMP